MSAKNQSRPLRKLTVPAMAAALAALFLTVGFYLQLGEFWWYFVAAVCVMATLGMKAPGYSALAFLASLLVALLLNGFNFIYLLPYAIFIGIHPVVSYMMKERGMNRVLSFLIKCVWFNLTLFAIYKFTLLFAYNIPWIDRNIIYIILVPGSALFALYDTAMGKLQSKLDRALARFLL